MLVEGGQKDRVGRATHGQPVSKLFPLVLSASLPFPKPAITLSVYRYQRFSLGRKPVTAHSPPVEPVICKPSVNAIKY